MQTTTKVWDKERMQRAIDTKYTRFTFHKVIKVIYDRQTEAEKANQRTDVDNSMGFNATDAKYLTDVYQKAIKYGNGALSERQFERAKRMMKKYWRQLCEVANAKLDAEEEAARKAA